MADAVEGASAVYIPRTPIPASSSSAGTTGQPASATRPGSMTSSRTPGALEPTCLPRAPSWLPATTRRTARSTSSAAKAHASAAENTTWEYTPGTNTFATKTSITNAVAGAAGGVASGHLYLAGGQDSTGAPVPYTWDYDIALDTWTQKTSMPVAQNTPGGAVAGGKLWIFGGGDSPLIPDLPGATTGATYSYDPALNTWTAGPSLNVPRSKIAGSAIGNRLVAAGGYDGSSSTTTTEVLDAATASCETPTTTFAEDFDGVTPPALPTGWTAANTLGIRRSGRRPTAGCPRLRPTRRRMPPTSTTGRLRATSG